MRTLATITAPRAALTFAAEMTATRAIASCELADILDALEILDALTTAGITCFASRFRSQLIDMVNAHAAKLN